MMNGYNKQLVTINTQKVALLSVILLIGGTFVMVGIQLLLGFVSNYKWYHFFNIVVALFGCFLVHEIIHALCFILIGGSKFKQIKLGINLKAGIMYCTTLKPLKKWQYLVSIVMPTVITVISAVLITVYTNPILSFCAAVLISGCAGDIMMTISIFKQHSDCLILDHPTLPAYYLLYDNDALPNNFIEVTDDQEKQLDEQTQQTSKSHSLSLTALMVIGVIFGIMFGVILVIVLL